MRGARWQRFRELQAKHNQYGLLLASILFNPTLNTPLPITSAHPMNPALLPCCLPVISATYSPKYNLFSLVTRHNSYSISAQYYFISFPYISFLPKLSHSQSRFRLGDLSLVCMLLTLSCTHIFLRNPRVYHLNNRWRVIMRAGINFEPTVF